MLEILIQEGESFKKNLRDGMVGKYVSGDEYHTWVMKCMRYLEVNFPNSELTKKFIKESDSSSVTSERTYHILLGIVKAINEIPEQ